MKFNENMRLFKWSSKLYIHIIGEVQEPFYLKYIRIKNLLLKGQKTHINYYSLD